MTSEIENVMRVINRAQALRKEADEARELANLIISSPHSPLTLGNKVFREPLRAMVAESLKARAAILDGKVGDLENRVTLR